LLLQKKQSKRQEILEVKSMRSCIAHPDHQDRGSGKGEAAEHDRLLLLDARPKEQDESQDLEEDETPVSRDVGHGPGDEAEHSERMKKGGNPLRHDERARAFAGGRESEEHRYGHERKDRGRRRVLRELRTELVKTGKGENLS